MKTRSIPIIGLASIAFLVAAVSNAQAGSYEVVACDAAGPSGANNSWVAETTHGGMEATVKCPTGVNDSTLFTNGNGLIVSHKSQPKGWTVPSGAAARFRFRAPDGAYVVSGRFNALFRSLDQSWQVALSDGSKLLRGVPAGRVWLDMLTEGQVVSTGNVPEVSLEVVCKASSCPAWKREGSLHQSAASATIRSARVLVGKDTPPRISHPRGGLWSGAGIRSTQDIIFDASDSTGIKSAIAYIDGKEIGRVDRECDPTLIRCPDGGAQFTVNTADYTDGDHTLMLRAVDRAGNQAEVEKKIRFANYPQKPQQVKVAATAGGAPNRFLISWENPQHTAQIVKARYKLCRVDSPDDCVRGVHAGDDVKSAEIPVDSPGQWKLTLWLEDEAGNTREANSSDPVILRYQPNVEMRWHGKVPDVDVAIARATAEGYCMMFRQPGGPWTDLEAESGKGLAAQLFTATEASRRYEVRPSGGIPNTQTRGCFRDEPLLWSEFPLGIVTHAFALELECPEGTQQYDRQLGVEAKETTVVPSEFALLQDGNYLLAENSRVLFISDSQRVSYEGSARDLELAAIDREIKEAKEEIRQASHECGELETAIEVTLNDEQEAHAESNRTKGAQRDNALRQTKALREYLEHRNEALKRAQSALATAKEHLATASKEKNAASADISFKWDQARQRRNADRRARCVARHVRAEMLVTDQKKRILDLGTQKQLADSRKSRARADHGNESWLSSV